MDSSIKKKKPTIPSLTTDEVEKLVQDITASTSILNATSFDNKVVVFKIESSRLGNSDMQKLQALQQNIEKNKTEDVIMSILDKLKIEYTVKSNMEVKEK